MARASDTASQGLRGGGPGGRWRERAEEASAGPGDLILRGLGVEHRKPARAVIGQGGVEPLLPVGGVSGGKPAGLAGQPPGRVRQRLRIVVQAQDQRANRFVPAAALGLDELLDRLGRRRAPGVMFLQQAIQGFIGQQTRLFLGEHRELWVEFQLVEVLPHEPQAEAVERADVGGVEQGQLLAQMRVVRVALISPSSWSRIRWRISAAAASVKVTMRISSSEAGGWSASRQARQRSTNVLVLPVPAPATTSTLPRAAIAVCWAEVRFMESRSFRSVRVFRPTPARRLGRGSRGRSARAGV